MDRLELSTKDLYDGVLEQPRKFLQPNSGAGNVATVELLDRLRTHKSNGRKNGGKTEEKRRKNPVGREFHNTANSSFHKHSNIVIYVVNKQRLHSVQRPMHPMHNEGEIHTKCCQDPCHPQGRTWVSFLNCNAQLLHIIISC